MCVCVCVCVFDAHMEYNASLFFVLVCIVFGLLVCMCLQSIDMAQIVLCARARVWMNTQHNRGLGTVDFN
jgi:hypothetical protein